MDQESIEKALLQQVRAALNAYLRAAEEHRTAIESAQARRWQADQDGHHALYIAATSERQALERYVQVLKALTDIVAQGSSWRVRAESSVPQFQREALTPRESEVLRLIASGLSSRDIAQHLKVSVKTVIAHRYQLMRKLDLHNVASLIRYAVQKKIVEM